MFSIGGLQEMLRLENYTFPEDYTVVVAVLYEQTVPKVIRKHRQYPPLLSKSTLKGPVC